MLRALMRHKEGDATGGVVILGITAENVRRLKLGQPIRVALAEMVGELPDKAAEDFEGLLNHQVVIIYGDEEKDIIAEIEEHVPSEKIHGEPR